MSRPSFQFYHGDWFSNAKLRRCTKEEKGHWIDTICLLADADEFGILRWPLKDICEAIGGKIASMRALVEKGVLKGADVGQTCKAYVYTPRSGRKDGEPVLLIPEQPGPIWYSSKMVRDDYIRANAGKNTRFGHSPSQREGDAPTARHGATPIRRHGVPPSQREGDGSPSPSPSPYKSALSKPPVDNSTRRSHVSSALRAAGVKVTSQNPLLVAWVDELHATDAQLTEALERARIHKPSPELIPAKYLDTVLRDVCNPKPAQQRVNGAWWTSEAMMKAMGREVGVVDRPGESREEYVGRINAELDRRKAAGASTDGHP